MSEATPVALSAVVRRLERRLGPVELVGSASTAVGEVRFDHRTVRPGDLFCCVPGELRDAHDLAGEARGRGAAAFLCERDLKEAAGGAPQLIVGKGRARVAMAHAACVVAGDPAADLRTIGVTGTNGKTTTTYLLAAILEQAGFAATVVGTLSGARTTPEAPDLQRDLAAAAAAGTSAAQGGAVALEVTSHALVQHRVDGYVHDVAVFTNLSQDHLDYHGTMERYFAAKATLFSPEHARRGVVNADDAYGRRLLVEAGIDVEPFSANDLSGVEMSADGTVFAFDGHEVRLHLIGRFNVENALAAAAAGRALGLDAATIAAGLSAATAPPGRLERVGTPLEVTVVVDYAHTPAGLENACSTLRDLVGVGARLVVVFGAGGDRDREKRPEMGHQASSLADVAVLTSDNPRHEEPAAIIDDVRRGCDGAAELHVEPDRRAAIALALRLARPGDVVLLAGKGHETTQQVGDEYLAFDDRLVAAEEAGRLAGAA